MFGGRNWLRKAAMLLALCAGGIGASAPAAANAAGWTADPDDQFLLDVNIRQLRLGDGVRAYNTPEGTCVVLGDFLTDARRADAHRSRRKKASGWAFKETNKISDRLCGAARPAYGGKTEPIAPGTIRETPEGWCVQTAALARWFGIGVKPLTAGFGADAAVGGQAAGRARDGAPAARGAHPSGELRPLEPAAGARPLPHVARAGARLRRQRRA